MKKQSIISIITLLLCLCVIGCGSDSGTSASESGASEGCEIYYYMSDGTVAIRERGGTGADSASMAQYMAEYDLRIVRTETICPYVAPKQEKTVCHIRYIDYVGAQTDTTTLREWREKACVERIGDTGDCAYYDKDYVMTRTRCEEPILE